MAQFDQIITKSGGKEVLIKELPCRLADFANWRRFGIPWKHHAKIARLTGLSPEDIAASRPDSKSEAA